MNWLSDVCGVCRERLGGHKKDARISGSDEGLQENKVSISSTCAFESCPTHGDIRCSISPISAVVFPMLLALQASHHMMFIAGHLTFFVCLAVLSSVFLTFSSQSFPSSITSFSIPRSFLSTKYLVMILPSSVHSGLMFLISVSCYFCYAVVCFSYVNYNLMKYMDKHKVKPDNKAFHLVRDHYHLLLILISRNSLQWPDYWWNCQKSFYILKWNTVEPLLSDLWFGRPLVLGDHNPRHGSFLTIKYLAWATTCQTRPATGSFGLTNDSFTCYEWPDHAVRGHFRQ